MDDSIENKAKKVLEDIKKAVDYSDSVKPPVEMRYKTITMRDVYDMPEADVQWLCEDFIPMGAKVLLAAVPNVGKSMLCEYISYCVVSGTKLFGVSQCNDSNVLLIDRENSYTKHLKRRFLEMGLSAEQAERIHLFDKETLEEFTLKVLPEVSKWLKQYIKDNNIGLVVIDTFISLAKGIDENVSTDVRAIIDAIRNFADENVTVILIDHLNKQNVVRGSGDKIGAVDLTFEMTYANDEKKLIKVSNTKNKDADRFAPFYLERKRKTETEFLHYELTDDPEHVDASTKDKYTYEVIWKYLKNHQNKAKLKDVYIAVQDAGGHGNEQRIRQLIQKYPTDFKLESTGSGAGRGNAAYLELISEFQKIF